MDENLEDSVPQLQSREYQIELFELGIEKNIIIYLPTGSGKTYIATLLIKHFCNADKEKIYLPIKEGGRRSVFLVNTVALVDQQTKQISSLTSLVIGKYSGDMNVDLWEPAVWEKELNEKQVLVMTAQIFLDLLQNNRMSLLNVNLIVFDECHRGVSNHPMRQIMKLFSCVPSHRQPRVLGLSATLLNGDIKPNAVSKEIRDLEITYLAEIQTSLNEDMVQEFSTNPCESKVVYSENDCSNVCYRLCSKVISELKTLISSVQIEDVIQPPVNSQPKYSYQIGSKDKKTNKRLKNLLDDIEYNLNSLGILGGSQAVLAHLVQIQQMLPNVQEETARLVFQTITTECVLLRKYLEDEIDRSRLSDLEALRSFSSDKVKKLFNIMKKIKSGDSAIVFVQRRFSAKVLYYILKKASQIDPKLNHINCNFVVGYNAGDPFKDTRENYLQRKQNKKVMNLFNKGELNVLFASNVVEEGVDISKCNYVVMFDSVLEFRSYVQSKGRARDKDSNYIIMVSRYDKSFESKYESFRQTEEALQNILYKGKSRLRTAPTRVEIDEKLFTEIEGLKNFRPLGNNGPVVTALSAVSLINRYFSSLKIDKFTKVNHFWFIKNEDSKYRCFLQLPMEAKNPVLVKGTLQANIENAKRSAALEACKQLYESGELVADTLLPVSSELIINNSKFTPNYDESEIFEEIVNNKLVKLGTKKNKRIHEKKWPECLSSCFPKPDESMYLHLIDVTTKYSPPTDNHRLWMVHQTLSLPNHFAILSTKKLPKLAPFPLFLSTGELKAKIHPGKKIQLKLEEILEISNFQFTIFDKVLEVAKKFMIRDFTNTQNAYLIAPVVKNETTITIDWDVIKESTKLFPSPHHQPTLEERKSLLVNDENYFQRVVTPWYRTVPAQKYIVTKVCYDMSEDTQFPTDNYRSYKEYFQEKYKISPESKGQPLLEVRAISSKINSIKPRAPTKQSRRKNKDDNEEFEVWLLPEFCIVFPLPGTYWLKAQLLPSALHRISQLCLAEELRQNIARFTGIGNVNVSSEWIELTEDVSLKKSKDSDQDKPQDLKPLLVFTNLNSTFNNGLELWNSEEEPIDIERNMDSATIFDIFTYESFTKKSFVKDITNKDMSLSEITGTKKIYGAKMCNPPSLDILGKGKEPQQVELLQALTTAFANDMVNCERLETLGDSFLKFAISLSLFESQPDLHEGHLTNIKGKIVGNKNLYFCGKKKKLGPILGVHAFAPKDDWVAPGFHVPHALQEVIRSSMLNSSCLYQVEIPDEERKAGLISSASYQMFEDTVLSAEDEVQANNCSCTNQLAISDKNISDAVEAILGVYLKNSGILGAFAVMNWFGVTDPSISSREVLTRKPTTAARSQHDPNVHLQQPKDLESILNYKFQDRSFLLQALSHPSYARNNITKCYQRLEFLGDAIIDFLITLYIFENCSMLDPGDLTDLRSALVNNITLACISVRNNFHKFLLFHSSLLNEFIVRFVKNQEEKNHIVDHDILFLVEEKDVNIAEAVDVPKALGDVFEALVGAIYLDSGKNLEVTWKVVYNLMKTEIENFSKDIPKNHIRMLYESVSCPEFQSAIEKDGLVMVTVEINHQGGTKKFNGFGDNKRQAKRAASKHALRYLRSTLQN